MASAEFVPSCEFNAAYISGLKEHDPTVENHFVEYFSPILKRKLRGRTSSGFQPSDVQQETFTRVLAAIRAGYRIQHPDRLGAFVSGVCNNVLLEIWRAARRYQPLETIETGRPNEGMLVHDLFIRGETARQTRLVLSRLSAKNKRLLEAVFLEEADRDHLCRELGVSRTNLRVLLHRAKKQFLDEYRIVWKKPRRASLGLPEQKAGTRNSVSGQNSFANS